MAGFKSFQELAQYLEEDKFRQFLDKDKSSKKAYLRSCGIIFDKAVFGKYNRGNNTVEMNITNPLTGERPIEIKLIDQYDIPQSDKMLQVFLMINDQLNESSDPSDILTCDITHSKKEEIARIKENREKQIAERKAHLKREKERKEREKDRKKEWNEWSNLQIKHNIILRKEKERYNTVNRLLYRAFENLSQALIRRQYYPVEGYPSEYNNIFQQEQYILRYLYAYSCEYTKMFLDLIEMGLNKETISVLSAGCGSMIDAWSLIEATQRTKTRIKNIIYTGLDVNKWEYIVETEGINKEFIPIKAGRYYEKLHSLDYDLYCFPKSIGDIAGGGIVRNDEDFERIINAFKTKEINKDIFFVAIAMISYRDSPRNDMTHAERIKDTITSRGYDYKTIRWKGKETYVGNSMLVDYPFDLDSVNSVAGSKPMMSRKYENYVIYKFSKVKGNDTQR